MSETKEIGVQGVLFKSSDITSIKNRRARVKLHLNTIDELEYSIRENPKIVHLKLKVVLDDDTEYYMSVSAFYINMVLWLFNTTFNEPITQEDVRDFEECTGKVYQNIMDSIVSKFIRLGHDLDSVNLLGTVKIKIITMVRFYSVVMSNTFSLYDLMALESRDPIFAQLFNTTLDPENMPISEIEVFLRVARDVVYERVIEDGQSTLFPYISSGVVNKMQMGQMSVAVGARADIDKSILPTVVTKNWIHGLQTNDEFYVEAVSTRNSIVVKKESVPASGYLSRKVNIACLSTTLDTNIFDCGTTHYMDWFIKDMSHLRLVEGKYMMVNPVGPVLREISTSDVHLIGTKIKFRTHTKCVTGHTLNKVCCVCLGNKHITLKDSRIGGLVAIRFINRLSQLGLSAKHASETKSEGITDPLIVRNFGLSRGSLYKKSIPRTHRKLLLPLELVNDILSSESVMGKDELEDGLNFSKVIKSLYIIEGKKLNIVTLQDRAYFLYISDKLVSMINSNSANVMRVSELDSLDTSDISEDDEFVDEFISIDFDKMNAVDSIFDIKLLTEEVSKYLSITKSVIDGSKTPTYERPEEPIADLVDILIQSGIGVEGMMIHMETLILNLMRSESDIIKHPDYSGEMEPIVDFIKLNKTIVKADLFSGLIYEDLKRQLENPDTIRKNSPGVFDIFFSNTDMFEKGDEYRVTRSYLFEKSIVN